MSEEPAIAATHAIEPSESPQPTPADPRPFQLRGDAPRVVRLSRKALTVVGGIAALGVGGSLIYALVPADRRGSGTWARRAASAGRHTDGPA